MLKKNISFAIAVVSTFFISVSTCYSFGDFGTEVNSLCAPAQPYTGSCALCHTGSYGSNTAAKNAFLNGGTALTDFFCPPVTTCTDNDGDSFALEGGDCGPVDCNDSDAAVNPAAAENCTDGMDNDCDGMIDAADPNATGCPPICTDNDADTFALEGGACGPVDCDDTDSAINTAAVEICDDGVDNNCDGQIDEGCVIVPTCTDNDADTFATEGGECGPVDCDDADSTVNPAAAEVCDDGVDNNCNGQIDEGCVIVPTCTDLDADTFATEGGECGPVDCDDTDDTVNPAAEENCTDGVDNNCNGFIDALDDTAVNCPPICTDSDGDIYASEGGVCGPVDCDDNDAAVNPGAMEICDDAIDNDCDGQVDEGCDVSCADFDGDGFMDAACGGDDCNDEDSAINPAGLEVCGNGIDENCNGTSDDTCITCPDGGVLIINKAEYKFEDRKLEVTGRSYVNTRISIVNAETGDVLAKNVRVKGGKWQVTVKRLNARKAPQIIEAINSEGCSTEQEVKVEDLPRRERDDDDDDDHDDHDEKDD